MIMTEKENGLDEAGIARKLLQKGATPAQIRRIKEKYEQEQNALGAVDLTGKGANTNRLRDGKKNDGKKNDGKKNDGNFIASLDEKTDKDELTKDAESLASLIKPSNTPPLHSTDTRTNGAGISSQAAMSGLLEQLKTNM